MSKEVTQERAAEKRIQDGRKWGKKKRDREREKGEALQRPFLLGS